MTPHTTKMKVLFVLPDLRVGGIERVRLTLIEQFVADGIESQLALRRCRGELLDRARATAPVHELAPRGIHQFVPALARLIRREKPTHVISAFSDVGFLVWMALRLSRSDAKWFHSVHSTHSSIGSRPGALGRLRYWLENCAARFVYRRVDMVVAVSEGIAFEIITDYHTPAARVVKISNPVVPDNRLVLRKRRLASREAAAWRIVCIGRLVPLKGFELVIKAMKGVPGNWTLDIWGIGPEHARLQAAILQSGLSSKIKLRGYAPDPYEVLGDADLFVLASRHEGLPATLIEALACQCQIVSTDCPHGPREILDEGRLGQLVPPDDSSALAEAINKALDGKFYTAPDEMLNRAYDFSRTACCANWIALIRGP